MKHIPIGEFRELGFLQEANRLFFHPHGLALEVTLCDDCGGDGQVAGAYGGETDACPTCDGRGTWVSGVWDYRDDPEGVLFGAGDDRAEKAATVAAERARHRVARATLFGLDEPCVTPSASDIEPIDWDWPEGKVAT